MLFTICTRLLVSPGLAEQIIPYMSHSVLECQLSDLNGLS